RGGERRHAHGASSMRQVARCSRSDVEGHRLRRVRGGANAPPAIAPAVSRAEDVDQAVKATQTRIEHGRQRLDRLQQLRTALDKLVEQGSICEGDAAVLEEHLFKMQVLAGALADRAAKDPKKPAFPKEFARDPLAAAVRKLSERISEVLGTTQAARREAQDVLARAKEAESAVQEDQTRLATLQQTQEATRQLLQWEEKLRT